jgi:hypothetical protein
VVVPNSVVAPVTSRVPDDATFGVLTAPNTVNTLVDVLKVNPESSISNPAELTTGILPEVKSLRVIVFEVIPVEYNKSIVPVLELILAGNNSVEPLVGGLSPPVILLSVFATSLCADLNSLKVLDNWTFVNAVMVILSL